MAGVPYEMKGIIDRVEDIQEISERFSIKNFILRVPGPRPDLDQYVKFQLNKKYFELVNRDMIDNEVTVNFYINGRKTQSGYWNTLAAVNVKVDSREMAPPPPDRETAESNVPF